MEDTEDDARYPSNSYHMSRNSGISQRPQLQTGNVSYPQQDTNHLVDDDDDEDEIEEEVEEEEEDDDDDDDDDDNEDDNVDVDRSARQLNKVGNFDDEMDDESDEDEDDDKPNGGSMRDDEDELERHQKKRKLKSLLSSYEFAPRVAGSSLAAPSSSKPSFGGHSSLADWTEHETLVLLEAWGDKFLKRGRKSLRSEEWQEVAEEVSQESKIERSDTQCRNRLDTLKKKYKKEKIKTAERGGSGSKWVYFRKMDSLMSPSPPRQSLSCGMDSGEYVFMNPKAYLDLANGMDELRDSPCNSESVEGGEDDDLDGILSNRRKMGNDKDDGASFILLADSIDKFGDIYEKIEHSKRQQLLELEKMRMDFQRELELQKRQILERAETEIARIRQGGEVEENDLSTENLSG